MKNTSEPEYWKGYRIERVNSSHYSALAQLLRTATHTPFTAEHLQKKYATEFLGASNVGYLAFDGDLAVSHQMGMVLPLLHQGKSCLSLQSCDSATHPDYRKKELWATLNRYLFHQAPLENTMGIIGLPNQHSYHLLLNKLGYSVAGMFRSYTIPIHTIPFWRISHKLKCNDSFIQYAEKNLKKHEIPPFTFSSFDPNEHLIVYRTPAYLAYKMQMGSFFIELSDTAFWIKIRLGDLFIGDLKTPSETHFDKAMTQLKALCFRSGLKNITFQSQAGSFEESLFAEKYEAPETMPMVYKAFEPQVPYHLLKCTYADLDTF
ncbi:MAG: GNAT family N-acetyltransferase [Spirosomataceae bacterium]